MREPQLGLSQSSATTNSHHDLTLSTITTYSKAQFESNQKQQQKKKKDYDSQGINKSYFGVCDNNQYFLSLKEKCVP